MQKIQYFMLLIISYFAVAPVLAAENKAASKKAPHSTIVIRPGPPVKPTQAAKPNDTQKSDWGNAANLKR